uniref:Uncharacterized protein n=1 Tax=Anopheles quadriannulatus TaxID=34691 RepID=A0A182XRR1_ANOQN
MIGKAPSNLLATTCDRRAKDVASTLFDLFQYRSARLLVMVDISISFSNAASFSLCPYNIIA